MIKRLVDEENLPDEERQLADLLRAAARYEPAPFRQQRILLRLEQGATHSRRRFWLRPWVGALLLASGSAAAALGHRYVPAFSSAASTGQHGALGAGSAGAPTPGVSPPAPARPESSASDAPEAPPIEVPSTPELVQTPAAAAPVAKSGARVRPDPAEDAARVVEAIQALRTEHDPARAQRLLNEYLKTEPHGVLSGDALALSIEAASARSDPRAADYARRYLANFPKGKYRELAERALEREHSPR